MRVLINAVTVSPRAPGNWSHLCNLLRGWKAAETSDHILVAAHPSFPHEVEVELSGLVEIRRTGLGRFGLLLTQHARLDAFARRFPAHVVLNATPVGATLVPVRRPQVTVVHDMRHIVQPEEFSRTQMMYREFVYHRSIRESDAVIAISERTRRDVVNSLHVSPARVHVVAHGADHVDDWARGAGGTHAVAFAHWSNKRPDIAVRVWAMLRDSMPGFQRRLEIVGAHGDLRADLEALIRGLRLGDIVRLNGYLPDTAYQALFSSASVVLFPSTLEGFGLPVIEGLRLGIPVIASAGAGIEYAGGDAALYAAGDAESFATVCRRLFTDDGWRQEVVDRGVGHASGFTWKATALATRTVLRGSVLAYQGGGDLSDS